MLPVDKTVDFQVGEPRARSFGDSHLLLLLALSGSLVDLHREAVCRLGLGLAAEHPHYALGKLGDCVFVLEGVELDFCDDIEVLADQLYRAKHVADWLAVERTVNNDIGVADVKGVTSFVSELEFAAGATPDRVDPVEGCVDLVEAVEFKP